MGLFKKKEKLELPKPNYTTPTFEPKQPPQPISQDFNIPRFPEPEFSESFQTYKPIILKNNIEQMNARPMRTEQMRTEQMRIETIKEAVKPKIELIRDDLDENILTSENIPRREESMSHIFEARQFEPKQSEQRSLESPLFIKIDTYEHAIREIELIKDNIGKINEVLMNLDTIKKQEDREIEQWKERVSRIKEKILSVDKNLFERK